MNNPLPKIQNLPEHKRKIIFWIIIIILALFLLGFYIKNIQKRLKSIEPEELKKEVQLPSLETELKKILKIKIPEIKMPKINQESCDN